MTPAAWLIARAATAGAAATNPPTGSPDLAEMEPAADDLPEGATELDDHHTTEPRAVAAYDRSFRFSRTAIRRSGLSFVDVELSLLDQPATASATLSQFRRILRNPRSRRAFARAVAHSAGLPAKDVSAGTSRDVALPSGRGVALPLRFHKAHLRLNAVTAAMTGSRTARRGQPVAGRQDAAPNPEADGDDERADPRWPLAARHQPAAHHRAS